MSARPAHIPALHLAAVIVGLLATSCSRELPTALSTRTLPSRAHTHRFVNAIVGSEVVITLAPGADAAAVAASHGASVLHFDAAQGVASLVIDSGGDGVGLLPGLASDPRVTSSEANTLLQTAEGQQKSFAFDDGLCTPTTYVEQPAAQELHLASAHAIATGAGVKVAILDTGIDPNHTAFAGRIVASYDFVSEQPGGNDVAEGVDTNGDGVLDGSWGHGTHVAGIVMLTAPNARLIVGRVLDSDGIGDVVTVAAGIRWAVSQGANVINLSLGALQSSSAIAQAVEYAEQHGAVVVASAGNWGAEFPHQYPASDPDVAAIAACDAYAAPAPWASFAPYIKLSAPGVGVRSTYPGGVYRLWSGSSMSAPFVTGTAAMLLELHPTWSQSRIMSRITGATVPLVGLTAGNFGMFGSGMLDAGAALAPDAPSSDEPPAIEYLPVRH